MINEGKEKKTDLPKDDKSRSQITSYFHYITLLLPVYLLQTSTLGCFNFNSVEDSLTAEYAV